MFLSRIGYYVSQSADSETQWERVATCFCQVSMDPNFLNMWVQALLFVSIGGSKN